MEIRPLRGDDLEELCALWNQVFLEDEITAQTFVAMAICDDNYQELGSLVAVDHGRLVGYGLGIYRKYPYYQRGLQKGTGWLPVLFTAPGYRRRGIGTALYQQMETYLKQCGVENIILAAYSPFYFFTGIDKNWQDAVGFFEKQGYKRGAEHYWMERSLHDYEIPGRILEKKRQEAERGYEFRHFMLQDSLVIERFLSENFSPGWRQNVVRAIREGAAEDTIYMCLYGERVAGYVQRAIDGNPERYGPFGMGEAFRNQGLGSILLHEMLWDMKQRGISKAFFKSTEEHGRRMYERNGFAVKRVFCEYQKLGI